MNQVLGLFGFRILFSYLVWDTMGTKMDFSTPSDETLPSTVNPFPTSTCNIVSTFPVAEIVEEIVDHDQICNVATNYEKLTTFT